MPRLAVVPELDAELDRLYGLPLEEFTAARNELATRLRKAGQAEAAERIRALRKPSVAVWGVNQLARRHPDELAALVDAARRLRKAQGEALRGRGPDSVRAATAAERDALRKLTRLAERLLADEGRAASPVTLGRIAKTLRAASVDPDAVTLLEAGLLPDEVESSGFAALASLAPPPKKGRRATGKSADRAAEREQLLRRLRKRVERLERRVADADERAERADRAAVEAQDQAVSIRAELEAARRELSDVES